MGEVSNALVCILGMGVVFIGLICIVVLCMATSRVFSAMERRTAPPPVIEPASAAPDRQEMVAAISTAIAAFRGDDVSGIRILSIKKI